VHHSYLDKYARSDSPLHRLDARVKLILTTLCVVMISATLHPGSLFILLVILFIFALSTVARVPIPYLLKRSAVVLPFSGFAALSYAFTVKGGTPIWSIGTYVLTAEAIKTAGFLLVRSWSAVCFMVLLVNITPFDRLLAAMRSLKIPAILVMLLAFFYRFLYLLWDEVERMQRARNARYFGGGLFSQPKLLGTIVSALFFRAYDRSERVTTSMQARGWDGESWYSESVQFKRMDGVALLTGLLILSTTWMIRLR
jgi:cobalt/nickel transport system permease protein